MNDWSLSMATGGKPVALPNSRESCIFSQDGRFSIVVLTYQIRVYFLSTRQCIRTVSCDCTDVVDVKLDNLNPSQVLLFTADGEVITVNWKDKLLTPIVSQIDLELEHPLVSIIAMDEDSFYIVSGAKPKKVGTKYVYKVDRPDSKVIAETTNGNVENGSKQNGTHKTSKTTQLQQIDNSYLYAVSFASSKIAFVTNGNKIVLIDFTTNNGKAYLSTETIEFPFRASVTSVAVSDDSIIALGTSTGVIQVLYGGLSTEKPQRLFKWHVDQVRALQFTSDNNYLVSGGVEKVLVFWNLETEKTQFLPRLSGVIEKIGIDKNKDDYYSLLLKVNSSEESSEENHEVLVISAVDLISRLSVNSVRPQFANSLKSSLSKTKRKLGKAFKNPQDENLKYDYSTSFEIHPRTKNLYFPYESTIQAYDLVKNEQSFVQNAAPLLSTGKVRSETKLIDPIISLVSFTQDGDWMCTFDTVATSDVDNLLSQDDKQYALKFWKFNETSTGKNETTVNSLNNKTGFWELSTKIIDPHGNSNPVLAVTAAPSSYHNGLAFLTADNKGGLRVWRPRIPKEIYQAVKNGARLQQTAWTLRKSRASGALSSDAVSVSWSQDGSIIAFAHECSVLAINTQTFEEISEDVFAIPSLAGSRIRSISLVENHLVVLSKTRVVSFNLLTGELNPLVAKVNTTVGGQNLIAVDHINKLICLVVNYYVREGTHLLVHAKILIFKPDQLNPIHVSHHAQAIAAVRYFQSAFVFVDLNLRIGTVQPTSTLVGATDDLVSEMDSMLISAKAAADVINNRAISVSTGKTEEAEMEVHRVVDLNAFQPMFENTEGILIERLFERVMKVIR